MAITFSIPDTEIIVTTGQTEATCQEIHDAARVFESGFQMMGLDWIVDAGGKLPLGGGIFTEIVLSVRYPWTIRFEDEDTAHCAVTGGTLLAFDAGGSNLRPVATNYGLTISQSISGTLATTGSGVTQQDKDDITQGVWEELVANYTDYLTMGGTMLRYAYNGEVVINTVTGSPGTTFPVGTHEVPSNSLSNAKTIAENLRIDRLCVTSNLTVGAAESLGDYFVTGTNAVDALITLVPGCTTLNATFSDIVLEGTFGGKCFIRACKLGALANFSGWAFDSLFTDNMSITTANEPSGFIKCIGAVKAGLPIELDVNSASMFISGWKGSIKIVNKDGPGPISIELDTGSVDIESSCTAGSIAICGIGEVISDSSGPGCTVTYDSLIGLPTITTSVWSASEALRLLGLNNENTFIDNTVFGGPGGELTEMRIRCFDSEANASAATDGGSETTGLVATYLVETVYEGVGQVQTYKMTLQP